VHSVTLCGDLVLAKLRLCGVERLLINDRGNWKADPLVWWSRTSFAVAETLSSPKVCLPGIGFIPQKVMHTAPDPNAFRIGLLASAPRATIEAGLDALRRELRSNHADCHPGEAHGKDTSDDSCLFWIDFPASTVSCRNVAIAQRHLPTIGVPRLRSSYHPALGAFQDLCSFVLGQRTPHLEE
jgi:hypothetical protein